LVIWDLRPAWPDKKNKPCRYAEKTAILDALAVPGLPLKAPVYLICIEQELESWLLANERAIAAYLSTDAHPYKVPRTKKPDRVPMPKAVMVNHFRNARGSRYEDRVHALKVISTALDLSRLRHSASFARFEQKLLAC